MTVEQDTLPPWLRTRIYALSTSLPPLLAAYGLLNDQQAALWAALAVALVGNGTAVAYRPTKG